MKKFLSLVLALIMTMSLVTISAGATEYKDLTDKDEIEYEEAVAVLNRIGVITGYDDGSFRPETELTRGAAAKIIVSLLIGPEAANNLPNTTAPYPDVPASHTFAGVISYCKTAGIISGYGDGTFKPANSLTGFAFAKMLLGALGYNSQVEGFVDTGWTMNVAKVGNVTGLFDRLDFDGAGAVSREVACQLALNTLKATMVTYGGTTVVTGAQTLAVQGTQAMYVTSNNRDINANINRRVISAANNELTLEFGEEHFKDLRLEHDRYDPAYDVYGHPSNEWSYKKVTIGTFKLPADFTFTKQMAHIEDTVATKEKALGLRGYDTYSTDHRGGYVNWSTAASTNYGSNSPFADATQIHINGWEARVRNTELYKQTDIPADELKNHDADKWQGNWYSYDANDIGAANKDRAPSLSEICDLTDNGVTVEVYVCPVDADFITDVVVTRTQLMKVDRIASDYVDLAVIDSDSKDPRKDGKLTDIAGYNDYSLMDKVASVKDNNYDPYNVLKDLKSGDEVAVIPYTSDNGKTWEVGEAYVPETVSGALTNVNIYNTKSKPEGNAIEITVGGTTYPIAQWNLDMRSITTTKIRATKKDVTLLLDKDGNALRAKDVGASDDWIIVGDYYQATLSNGRVGWYVHGWTIKGDEVDLELGTIRGAAEKYAPGELVRYQVAEAGNGEYELVKPMYTATSPTGGRRVLKNGTLSNWIEPNGDKDGKVQTGQGIYNVSQWAKWDSGDKEYEINSRNTLIPLEFYDTDRRTEEKPYTAQSATGVHKNYNNTSNLENATVEAAGFYDDAKSETAGVFYSRTSQYNKWTYRTTPYDGVKFIFVGFDTGSGEVDTINVLDGVQNVEYKELTQINRWWRNVGTNNDNFVASPAEAYVDKSGKVKAVVIKSDSAEANLKDLIIITDNRGAYTKNDGGAEAPTADYYRTYQYVSGEDGFKEEKTGYFDRDLKVGTVLTGRMQSTGVFKTRIFHANEYTDRNPDGFYVKGIKGLYTQEGKRTDWGFYVGAKNGINDPWNLGTGVEPGKNVLSAAANILGTKDVMGIDTGYDKQGLIKVDSTTQFIDLRDGHLSRADITELGDLFDDDKCDPETAILKVLVNGNDSSDGFRHAYAVMVLEAKPAASKATNPLFNITVDGKNAWDAASKTYKATVRVDDEPELAVAFTNESDLVLSNVSYKWTTSAPGSWLSPKNAQEATFYANKAGTYTVTVEVQYTDTSKDVEKSEKVSKTIEITVGDGAGVVTFTDGTKYSNGMTIDTAAISVASSKAVPDFRILLPEWAELATKASTFDVSVFRNGSDTAWEKKTAQTFTDPTTANGTLAFVGPFTVGTPDAVKANYVVGDDLRAVISNVKFDKVKVQFVDKDGNEIEDFITADVSLNGLSGGAFPSFTLNTTADKGKLKLTYLSGLDETSGAITATKEIDLSKDSKTVTGFISGTPKAANNGFIKIQVDYLTEIVEKRQIIIDSTATDINTVGTGYKPTGALGSDKIVLLFTPDIATTPEEAPVPVTVMAYFTTLAGNSSHGYTVTLTGPDGKDYTKFVSATTQSAAVTIIDSVTLTDKDWTIKDTSIKVEPAKAPELESAVIENGNLLKLKFKNPVKPATSSDDAGDMLGTLTQGSGSIAWYTSTATLSDDGYYLTVTISGAVAADTTIVVDDTKIADKTTGVVMTDQNKDKVTFATVGATEGTITNS